MLPVGQITDLFSSPRNPLDERVLAWGVSPALWCNPELLYEAGRDWATMS